MFGKRKNSWNFLSSVPRKQTIPFNILKNHNVRTFGVARMACFFLVANKCLSFVNLLMVQLEFSFKRWCSVESSAGRNLWSNRGWFLNSFLNSNTEDGKLLQTNLVFFRKFIAACNQSSVIADNIRVERLNFWSFQFFPLPHDIYLFSLDLVNTFE